jgi:transcriptional regulator with XRE-family HTH domain
MTTPLGDFIFARRKYLRMTQQVLGDKVGLTRQQISNIENGKTELPGPASLAKMAAALQAQEYELLRLSGRLQDQADVLSPELDAALQRIRALPTIEEQMAAASRFSPAVYELAYGWALGFVENTARAKLQAWRQRPIQGSESQDQLTSATDGTLEK